MKPNAGGVVFLQGPKTTQGGNAIWVASFAIGVHMLWKDYL